MRNRTARILVFLIAAVIIFSILSQDAIEASGTSETLKPLSDRVVVKVIERSGKAQKGEVITVGAGRFDCDGNRVKIDVKVGDKVLFSKYAGTEAMVEGEDYIILREGDILAIIEQ